MTTNTVLRQILHALESTETLNIEVKLQFWRGLTESPMVNHAIRELELLGQVDEDPGFAGSLIAAVACFAAYGHSGGSTAAALQMLTALLERKALTPVTTDPDEWVDRSDISGTPMWQAARDSTLFSDDGGRTHWDVNDPDRTVRATAEPDR